ncbi:MAG: hypothetical protein ACFE0O_15855 [Opitutales bacterium]
MNIKTKLKDIEKAEAKLARQKKELLAAKKEMEAREKKLEALVKESGFKSAKELVDALVEKYNIRLSAKRGPKPGSGKRRKRTKMTAALRDDIKKELKDGRSMNAVAKERGISYVVIAKVNKGDYDHL